VKDSVPEVKDVEIPQQMQRAIARQAESECDRRAKIIAPEGEYQASQRLKQAAVRLAGPTALQLRLFQTLSEIANEQSSTIILPVPVDLFSPYLSGPDDPGDRYAAKPRQEQRGQEEEAERTYEEASNEKTEREGVEMG